MGPGKKVGVVGLGGLGHMGLKFANSFGAHVVQFTTSESKIADAKRLGADEVVISKDAAAMKKEENSFDFILDTVSAVHDLNAYLPLLKRDAVYCQVGLPDQPPVVNMGNLLFKRRSLSGSIIGGMEETQEMLDYCAEHNIVSDVEVIPIQKVNEAFERVVKADVKYRFVIDMASLKTAVSISILAAQGSRCAATPFLPHASQPAWRNAFMATKKKSATKKSSAKKSSAKKSHAKKSASKKSSSTRKYSPAAGKSVEREMKAMKKGKLKSGRSGKKVTSRKQAIAIGLSEARKSGAKVPRKKSS